MHRQISVARRMLLLAVASVCWAAARPNVVLVMTDDQGYGDLACHGNRYLQTPHLDKLHAQSIRLTNFHASPLCAPTRAALLTGRYSNRTGVWHVLAGHSLLRRGEMTAGDVFRANGYRTGVFGKWHLGKNYPFRPMDRGFDESVVHGGGSVGTTPDYWGNDYFDDTYMHNGEPETYPGYGTNVLFDQALKFIEANRNCPFFCYLPTAAPHDPFNVSQRYSSPYAQKGLPEAVAAFYGMISNIDENMGRLIARLDEWGLSRNTILIFMTDNGSSGGWRTFNAGMRAGKGSAYEGGHRVPFFIRWPAAGMEGGRDIATLASHIDVLPTLIELCGLEAKAGPAPDGKSLAALLRGDAAAWPDRVVIVDNQSLEHPRKWRRSAVMTQRWRLIDGRELYDIGSDPNQQNDVAARHSAVVEKLRSAYEAWWEDIARTFLDVPHIVVGAPEENPTWLNTWDLHGQSAFMQYQIEMSERADGYWAVEVARDGEYEIALRRWPPEVNRAISDGLVATRLTKRGAKPQTVEGAHWARIRIGEIDTGQPIADDAEEVTFRVHLESGKTRFQAWFLNNDSLIGATHGVYYAGFRRL